MSRSKWFESGRGLRSVGSISALICSVVVLGLWVGRARADNITIVSPSSNALVSGKVDVTVTGKPDNAKHLHFYADGSQFAVAPARSSATKKWNTKKTHAGIHMLQVTAVDKTGASLASVQEPVFVGTGIVISSPPNNDLISGPLSVVCQTASSVQSVNVLVDGVQKASGPECSFSFPAGAIANGSHVIVAQAFGSGSTALGSDSIQIKVAQSTPSQPTASATQSPNATPSPRVSPTPAPTPSVTPASPSPGQTPSATPTPAPGANAYYVDPSGNDSRSGTSPGSAWQTVARVNSTNLRAGDVVYFKAGGEWRETLRPNASGSSGAPIVFTAYGDGNLPILSGSDPVADWSIYSGTIYNAELASEPVNVYVDTTANWGLTRSGSATSMAAGSWYWSGGQLYVRLEDDSDPSNHLIEAAVRPYGVFAQNRSYVTIDRLEVLRTAGWGIEFISTSNPSQTVEPVISNTVVSQNGTGTFDDGAYRNAIYINRAQSPTVEGNTVSYAGGHNGIQVQYATDVEILNNDVSHFNHSGLDTKFSDQVLYAGNVIHDSYNVSLYSQNSSNLTAENNIIYNIGGTVCGAADGIHFDIGTSGQVSVYNNSIYNTYCPIYLTVPAAVMNNAINDSGGPALRAVSGGTFDYNDLGKNGWVEIDSNQYNFSQWRALGGHSGDKDVDPEWESPGTGDMSLAPNSPCINAGTDVGLPYAGSQPDMGAVDSQ